MSEKRHTTVELMKLDGTVVHPDGSVTKSNLFTFLDIPPGDYSDIYFTEEEARSLRSHLSGLTTGSTAAIPIRCFVPGSPVVMGDGTLKNIEDIRIGEEVYTHLGRVRKVTNTYQHQVSEAVCSFRVGNEHTEQWTSFSTGGHPYWSPTKQEWISAADLKREDSLLMPFAARYQTDLSEEDWAWATLLGYYLAEGCGQPDRRDKRGHLAGDSVRFSLNLEEEYIDKNIRKACEILGYSQVHTYLYPEKTTRIVVINGKEPLRTLVRLGGRYSDQKRICGDVMNWPYKKQLVMFKTYLEGDGHWRQRTGKHGRQRKPEWSWKTVSKKLSEQLFTIALGLYLLPARPIFYDPPKKKRTYCGYLGGKSLVNLELDQPLLDCGVFSFTPQGVQLSILATRTKFYEGVVYNLEVEEDNSYCVDWIAVHNCGGAAVCPWKDTCPFLRMDRDRRALNPEAPPITPVGRPCHPPGEKVLTQQGYVAIENLEETHRLVGYERHHNMVRKGKGKCGYAFKRAVRDYTGQLITIKTSSGKQYRATADHICIARFNERAIGKFCVYLMRRGSAWRIGKSQILGRYTKDNPYGHKTFLGFPNRGCGEQADSMWILGVYDQNTDAALAEDYFSCVFQTSRVLFIKTSDQTQKKKYNGLYAWATQEQLDMHHQRLLKPPCFYAPKLARLGLSIDHPIWTSNNNTDKRVETPEDTKLKATHGMYIRACNIIPQIMDVPVYPEKPRVFRTSHEWFADWESVEIEREEYNGQVFSLEVDKYHAYFVNGIATHNCLVEANLVTQWTKMYLAEFDVEPTNMIDFTCCRELAEVELMLWRLNQNLSKPRNAELVQDVVVGIDRDGNPLTRQETSAFFDAKEKLVARKSRLMKMMVGDRQEKYKRDAALKLRDARDPSSTAADLAGKIKLALEGMQKSAAALPEGTTEVLTPDQLIQLEGGKAG